LLEPQPSWTLSIITKWFTATSNPATSSNDRTTNAWSRSISSCQSPRKAPRSWWTFRPHRRHRHSALLAQWTTTG
jgi:hypothetical protein